MQLAYRSDSGITWSSISQLSICGSDSNSRGARQSSSPMAIVHGWMKIAADQCQMN